MTYIKQLLSRVSWKIILKQVKDLDIVHNEGEGKHIRQSDERKTYFCFSEFFGTKGEEAKKERLI